VLFVVSLYFLRALYQKQLQFLQVLHVNNWGGVFFLCVFVSLWLKIPEKGVDFFELSYIIIVKIEE